VDGKTPGKNRNFNDLKKNENFIEPKRI